MFYGRARRTLRISCQWQRPDSFASALKKPLRLHLLASLREPKTSLREPKRRARPNSLSSFSLFILLAKIFFMNTQTLDHISTYLSALDFDAAAVQPSAFEQTPVDNKSNEQSFLSGRNIISFVSAVTEQTRKDILNATMLAQLAADKQCPMDKDAALWYKHYVEVLRNIGFVVESAEIASYETEYHLVEIQEVIIDILSSAFGKDYVALVSKTLAALVTEGKIDAFEKNVQSMTKACFQIGMVTEVNGIASMQMGSFMISSRQSISRVLFVKIKNDDTALQYALTQASLNSELYALAARELVVKKLSPEIGEYVREIDL